MHRWSPNRLTWCSNNSKKHLNTLWERFGTFPKNRFWAASARPGTGPWGGSPDPWGVGTRVGDGPWRPRMRRWEAKTTYVVLKQLKKAFGCTLGAIWDTFKKSIFGRLGPPRDRPLDRPRPGLNLCRQARTGSKFGTQRWTFFPTRSGRISRYRIFPEAS